MKHNALSHAAARIGFASTQEQGGGKPRWTELAIFHDPAPKQHMRPFVVMQRGCSTMPGERLREEVHAFGTLDRACGWFDATTQLGRTVITQARDWEDQQSQQLAACRAKDDAVLAIDTHEEALRYLYPEEPKGRATREAAFARDFGLGQRTVQTALKNGTEIRVPLLKILPLIDRAAWEAARG
jgi:hypothetical protein